MNFVSFNAHINPLFYGSNILKFTDLNDVESCIFESNCFNKSSCSIFTHDYKLISTSDYHNTKSGHNGLLFVPNYNTEIWKKVNFKLHNSAMELSSKIFSRLQSS